MVELARYVPDFRKANKAQLAEFFEVSVAAVDNWIRRGCPAMQRGNRGTPWVFDLLQVAEWRFVGETIQHDDQDPDTLQPKERLDWYKGESEKRKLQKTDGELVEASVYERHMADLLKVSVSWAETFTDVMEREAGLTPEQLERVQTAVDRQRDRLHKSWGPADV